MTKTMTPELNARIVEIELHQHRTNAMTAARWTPNLAERRETPLKLYAKYLRYALSSLAAVAFGLGWN